MESLRQFTLHWLQQQLQEICSTSGSAAENFPAELPLSELPGKPRMRSWYAALRRRGVTLPPLFLSRWQHCAIGALTFHVLVLGLMDAARSSSMWQDERIIGAAIIAALVWGTLAILTKLFFSYISSADNVGELAQQIFAENPGFFRRLSGQPMSRAQIQAIVKRILVDACGVDPSEVTLDTRLADIME